MAYAAISRLLRVGDRSESIFQSSDNPFIRVAGASVVEALVAFKEADRVVLQLVNDEKKERQEQAAASARLARVYDPVVSTIFVKLPHAELPARASAFSTPDEVLGAGTKVEDMLCDIGGVDAEHPVDGEGESAPTGEAWAVTLLVELEPALSEATAEYQEAVRAKEGLQKAQERRSSDRAVLEHRVVAFRRVVRDVFGARSKEYHSLRLRPRRSGGAEAENTPTQPDGSSPSDTTTP